MAVLYELPEKSVRLHWFFDGEDNFHLIAKISTRKDLADLKQAVKLMEGTLPPVEKSDWDEGQDIEVYRLVMESQ